MLEHRSGVDVEDGRVANQAPTQKTKAAAQPVQRPAQRADRTPDIHPQIAALVRLLARQAAREHLERLANPGGEETIDER
jgi:hypothetical protein